MERMTVISKLILIFFIMLTFLYAAAPNLAWGILFLLLYISLNITIHLLKQRYIVSLFLLVSITVTLIACLQASPIFILLMPLSILELCQLWTKKTIIPIVLAISPVFYIQQELQAIFLLVAIYTIAIFTFEKYNEQKHVKNEQQLDWMRNTNQKLIKQIHENDTYLKQSAYMFRLEERNRISQQIHDDVGHAITGALIQMEASKRMLHVDKEKAEELLQNAIGITQEGIEHIRLTLKNMKPSTEQVGINRLKLIIDEFTAKHDKQTILTYDGDIDQVNTFQWEVIQKNTTEALTNSMKYAENSTQIAVNVIVLNKLVKIEVKDNGVGAERFEKGLGIIGMEERSASMGGQVIVDGTNGFSVTTLLPLQAN